MIKYYEKITILEGIYLEKKELFLKKDFSKYFKLHFYFDGKKILDLYELKYFIEGNEKKINEGKIRSLHNFIYFLSRKKEFINISLDEVFYCKIESETLLNEREYKIKNDFIFKYKEYIKDYYQIFIKDIKENNIFQIDFINDKNFNIFRDFDFETFFSDNESLFDKENDFEDRENRKLYHGLKDIDNNLIENLETIIKNANEDNKFFIDIDFDKSLLDINKYDISGEKKYDYVFVLERGNYLVYKRKNG